MRLQSDKRDPEIEPKVLNLGRPNRIPLSSVPVNQVPVTQVTKISPSPLNTPVGHLASAIFPKVPHPQTHAFRIISQHIGIPFEIRIPTNEINYLEQEVKSLRLKCQLLANQQKQTFQDTCSSTQARQSREKEIQSTFLQISKSTKNIEDHLGNVLSRQCQFERGIGNEVSSQNEQRQAEQIIKSLEMKSDRIQQLEIHSRSLEQTLEQTRAQLQKVCQENELLRKQIAVLEKK